MTRRPKKPQKATPKAARRQRTPEKPVTTRTIPPATKAKSAVDKVDSGLFERWKAGEQIHALAAELSWKRSKVRRTIIAAAGGKEAFRTMRQTGAGGTTEAFGGKRAEPRSRETIAQDDSKVIRMERAELKGAGWTNGPWLRLPTGNVPTLVGPDGTEYVQAAPLEKATLIISSNVAGIPDSRLKPLTDSARARLAAREEKQMERGEAAIERTRTAKRTKRKLRKRTGGSDDE